MALAGSDARGFRITFSGQKMAKTEHVSVAVQEDFVARQTRAKPVPALAELIWNGLDGDATDIRVEFVREEKKKRLKERTQLHKILAENTWVFGEEYNLWVSDQGLRKVLEKQKKHLDPNISIDEPVKVVGQKVGIVDLMFSRMMRRHKAGDVDHLVVELKAPKVTIGADEIAQVKKYAQAVANDERFSTVKGLRWHFWVVSNAYDEYAEEDIASVDRERRLVRNSNGVTIGIKTWGELIDENRARLQFFQEKLDHRADESEAIRYLQERHSQFLEGVIVEGEHAEEGAEAPE